MSNPNLTAAQLREIIHYDPETGVFTWLINAKASRPAGSVAGSRYDRYIKITIAQRRHSAHRLAWLYMTGEWPAMVIDHINRDGFDNKFSNLRDVSCGANSRNSERQNSYGHGVAKNKGYTWRSQIDIDGESTSLGGYPSAKEAENVFLHARSLYSQGFDAMRAFAKESRQRASKIISTKRFRLSINGKPMSVAAAAKYIGIPWRTAYYRLQTGVYLNLQNFKV